MSALGAAEIDRLLAGAIAAAGGAISRFDGGRNPRRFRGTLEGKPFDWLVYAWTVTPGGRGRRAEYRIQKTWPGKTPAPRNATGGGSTLLLGCYPLLDVFVGVEFQKHRSLMGEHSPSVFVKRGTMRKAAAGGFAAERKRDGDTVIAFRSGRIAAYASAAGELHRVVGDERISAKTAERAGTDGELREQDLGGLDQPRRVRVQRIAKKMRSATFRPRVLEAYRGRCALTGDNLGVVEAAHILPVGAKGSTDRTSNGIALMPTLHRAFDTALIFLTADYRMRVNQTRLAELLARGQAHGLKRVEVAVGSIQLPSDARLRPDPEMIRRANAHRRIGE